MTKEEIENEGAIADFLGIRWHDNGTISYYPSVFNCRMGVDMLEDLQIFKDWSRLMYAVQNIESITDDFHGQFRVNIVGNCCTIYGSRLDTKPDTQHNADTKIQAVYAAVVSFIKWYNSIHFSTK